MKKGLKLNVDKISQCVSVKFILSDYFSRDYELVSLCGYPGMHILISTSSILREVDGPHLNSQRHWVLSEKQRK